MSETEALFPPMALMRNTPDVYDVEEITSWTWAVSHLKCGFRLQAIFTAKWKLIHIWKFVC